MKRISMIIVLLVAVSLISSQAIACMWDGNYGDSRMYGYNNNFPQDGSQRAFMNETRELRADLAEKKGEYEAIMAQPNPDPEKAGKISREMAGIHEQLQEKANASGLGAQVGPSQHGRHMGSYGNGHNRGWGCW